MTIAHLVIGGDVAGGQLVALTLARAARARGDRVVFLSPARGPFTAMVEREGMDVHLVDVSRTFHVLGALRLARLLRALRVDVLHTHTALAANVLSRVAGRLAACRRRVAYPHREPLPAQPSRRAAVHSALDNGSARLAARVLAVSAGHARLARRAGLPTAARRGRPQRDRRRRGVRRAAPTASARSSASRRARRSSARSRGSAT